VVADVVSARREWEAGYRRLLEENRDPAELERVQAEIDVVTTELRKRVGGVYTLRELAEAYAGAEAWARPAVADRAPHPRWPQRLVYAADAAFHLYARGAVDYAP
jgi:predicted kinase